MLHIPNRYFIHKVVDCQWIKLLYRWYAEMPMLAGAKGDKGEPGVKGKRGLIGFIGYKGEQGTVFEC